LLSGILSVEGCQNDLRWPIYWALDQVCNARRLRLHRKTPLFVVVNIVTFDNVTEDTIG
jgi:hypothetical protein